VTSSLPDIPAGAIRDSDVVDRFQHILTLFAAGVEKQAWMICAHA
jgi:hypothetical protein